jgi:hypothetical protein
VALFFDFYGLFYSFPTYDHPSQPRQMTKKQLSTAAAILGAKGGKAGTGDAKRRTSEQARKAINTRWHRKATTQP